MNVRFGLVTAFSAALLLSPFSALADVASNPTVAKAEVLMRQGKTADAIVLLDDELQTNPLDVRALVDRGAAYRLESKNAEALADFNGALLLDPNIEKVQLETCYILYEFHKLDDAIDACSKAIALNLKDVAAYDQRALSLDAKDDAVHEGSALKDVDSAIALDASNAWSYSERCELKLELKQYDAAIPDCDRALRLDPSSGWTWYQRGKLALEKADFASADTDFGKALDNHTTIEYAYVDLAQAQYGLDRYPAALQSVNVYIAKHPGVSSAYLTRAKINAKMGQAADANADANEALKDARSAKSDGDVAAAQAFLSELTSSH